MMEHKGNVDELLNTLLIPNFPPNRSQWRKLELALKFINISKNCAEKRRVRKESLKIEPKEPELLIVKQRNILEEIETNPKIQNGSEIKKSNRKIPKKESNWIKIRKSLHKIM